MVQGVGKKSEIRLKSEDSVPWIRHIKKATLTNFSLPLWFAFVLMLLWPCRHIGNWKEDE